MAFASQQVYVTVVLVAVLLTSYCSVDFSAQRSERTEAIHAQKTEANPTIEAIRNSESVHETAEKADTGRFRDAGHAHDRAEKAEAIRDAFRHAYRGYKRVGWGKDEIRPLAGTWANWLAGRRAFALTLVDSLDTMLLMELHEEYAEARDYLAAELSFHADGSVSVFESSIRLLAGLLSAYELGAARGTADEMLLRKALDLGERLLRSFPTHPPSPIPAWFVHLLSGEPKYPSWSSSRNWLANVGSLQLEFVKLSALTGDVRFAQRALGVYRHLLSLRRPPPHHLFPVQLDVSTGKFARDIAGGRVTFGSGGDSFYEYLLKLWLLTGRRSAAAAHHSGVQRVYYDEVVPRTLEHLVLRVGELTVLGEYRPDEKRSVPEMEHLACFAGGLFALGSWASPRDPSSEAAFELGKQLTHTCRTAYASTVTGLGAERWSFSTVVNEDGAETTQISVLKGRYLLRPELVESIFYLWRFTHDPIYRQWGWEVFRAIEKHCRVENGYVGLADVQNERSAADDFQQSFFLAETLKYLYLLFSPDLLLSLDEWVFNTEGHPLRVFEPEDEWLHLFEF
mmetsp:Transcript_22442/g.56300  ORF Transcript_22442/g.56300 Transcript_22442/m.56300 type:complete len:567 (-) Transcript_22442:36-1736(-)